MRVWPLLAVAAALFGAAALAQEPVRPPAPPAPAAPAAPVVGAPAPGFRLNDQNGKAVRLADLHEGGWAVVAFYPRAATPG
jgi:cytochrome oxidase Cu insertion factor (SCO1/SenC/PrrC family)